MKFGSDFTLKQIRAAFTHSLPGAEAQLKLAPDFRIKELSAPRPLITKAASVMILLYPGNGGWHFPLIHRALSLHDHHSRQISLPGGSRELNESIQTAAFRETEEEIGVPRDKLTLVGTLSTIYIPPSNFMVTPCVATMDQRPEFCCNASEVTRLFEVPLSRLMDPISFQCEELEFQDMKVQMPLFRIGSLKVFGATAMILSELRVLLETTSE